MLKSIKMAAKPVQYRNSRCFYVRLAAHMLQKRWYDFGQCLGELPVAFLSQMHKINMIILRHDGIGIQIMAAKRFCSQLEFLCKALGNLGAALSHHRAYVCILVFLPDILWGDNQDIRLLILPAVGGCDGFCRQPF